MLDAEGNHAIVKKGERKDQPKADPDLRETANVPIGEDLEEYLRREVLPHAPGAWIDHGKTKVGYEIPFRQYFHVQPLMRDLAVIDAELKEVTDRIVKQFAELPR